MRHIGAALAVLALWGWFWIPAAEAQYTCSAINCFNGKEGGGSSTYGDWCEAARAKADQCMTRYNGKRSACGYEIERAEKECGCAKSCSRASCRKMAADGSQHCYEAVYDR
jgi:hypothetical protein